MILNPIRFIGYNQITRDFKVYETSAGELKDWMYAVFKDSHFTIIILQLQGRLFVLEKVVKFGEKDKAKFDYTRTEVKYHPMAEKLKQDEVITLQANIKKQKKNPPEAFMVRRY